MNEEYEKFDDIFRTFKNVKDKYESLYIFVANGLMIDDFVDKINKMVGIIDDISNTNKRGFLKTRLKTLLKHLEGFEAESNVNGIFLLGNCVNEFDHRPYWTSTLKEFKCDNLMVKYGETYQFDWLKNLLIDRSYVNVLHVKNNVLKHIHLNDTKKRTHYEKTEKKMDLQQYINENIPKGETCMIHGISSFLKVIKENEYVKILDGDKKDDQLFEEYDNMINEKNCLILQKWLDKLLDPVDGKKIVFGVDIKNSINNKLLKTLFCTPEINKKILERIPQIDRVFDIIVVKPKQFGNNVGQRLETDFKGAVGIKFY